MMTRDKLIEGVKKYFKIEELVCPHCYNKFKESAWQFISTELLSTIYVLRTKVLNKPMIVNNWHNNGCFNQRGLRCNMCQLVKNKKNVYLSAHSLGKAIDFNTIGVEAEKVRKEIKNKINKFEYPIRLERGTSWVHIDCYVLDNSKRLTEFDG